MAPRGRAPAPETDDGPDESSAEGFSEGQLAQLEAMIAKAVGSSSPPKPPDTPKGPPAKTDDEWDAMSDRQRESWVRQLVDGRLDELVAADEAARARRDIDELKAKADKPEPEAPPGPVKKIQAWLWGEPDKKSA